MILAPLCSIYSLEYFTSGPDQHLLLLTVSYSYNKLITSEKRLTDVWTTQRFVLKGRGKMAYIFFYKNVITFSPRIPLNCL